MKNKFNAKKKEYNGQIFDSTKEANYCKQLDLLKSASGNNKVLSYETQVRYDIDVNDVHIGFYKLDFKVKYPNRIEYVDVKGCKKGSAYQLFRIRKKLVEAIYNIKITEK
ncbi:MAG: DUF1064 domain-containing protein [Bacteroidales bacterium]|jgi:hypothetical protein|nr:DUF1064 domain-containing protein [Bacteroidales bacterium]